MHNPGGCGPYASPLARGYHRISALPMMRLSQGVSGPEGSNPRLWDLGLQSLPRIILPRRTWEAVTATTLAFPHSPPSPVLLT